jgi:hypothetical protein
MGTISKNNKLKQKRAGIGGLRDRVGSISP